MSTGSRVTRCTVELTEQVFPPKLGERLTIVAISAPLVSEVGSIILVSELGARYSGVSECECQEAKTKRFPKRDIRLRNDLAAR